MPAGAGISFVGGKKYVGLLRGKSVFVHPAVLFAGVVLIGHLRHSVAVAASLALSTLSSRSSFFRLDFLRRFTGNEVFHHLFSVSELAEAHPDFVHLLSFFRTVDDHPLRSLQMEGDLLAGRCFFVMSACFGCFGQGRVVDFGVSALFGNAALVVTAQQQVGVTSVGGNQFQYGQQFYFIFSAFSLLEDAELPRSIKGRRLSWTSLLGCTVVFLSRNRAANGC